MATPGRGHKSYLQLVPEAAYGTKVTAATRRFEIISMDIHPEMGVIEDPSLNNQASRRAVFQGGLIFKGSFVVRANYEGMEELLRGTMGTATLSSAVDAGSSLSVTTASSTTITSSALFGSVTVGMGVTGSGIPINTVVTAVATTSSLTISNAATNSTTAARVFGAVNDYTFTENPTLKSYSIQLIEGAPQDVTTCNTVYGAYLTGLTIRGSAGQGADAMFQCEFSVLGKARDIGDTTTTGLIPAPPAPILFHQGLTVDPGTFSTDTSSTTRVRSIELAIVSPHTEDRFYVGSQNADQPIRNDFLTAKYTIQMEYLTNTASTRLAAGTVVDPQFIFRGAQVGASAFREFEFRSGTAIIDSVSQPVSGYGVILQTVTLNSYNDGTGDASCVAIRVRNGYQTIALP